MHYINIHTHHNARIKDELIIRNVYLHRMHRLPQVTYPLSLGLHPWHVNEMDIDTCTNKLVEWITHERILAIGEIGIDRSIQISVDVQRKYFEAQLNIARAFQKPVIIHAVKSYSDLLPYVKKMHIPFIFHQFQGNIQQAEELIKHGAYLSFGKNLFQPQTEHLFSKIPMGSFFLETDTANHLHISDIYRKAAELKKIGIDSIMKFQNDNFVAVFNKQI
jgi:TatD DNase family protein